MTDRIDPKAIADELREQGAELDAITFKGVSVEGDTMRRAADTIDALVKERDMRASESEDLERERDELATVVEKVRGVIGAEIGWESPAILIDRIQWALSTAPTDALVEHDAALIESLADAWSEWETFTASDGHNSIRQHGLSPDDWLRARAQQIREGGNR